MNYFILQLLHSTAEVETSESGFKRDPELKLRGSGSRKGKGLGWGQFLISFSASGSVFPSCATGAKIPNQVCLG